MKFGKNRYVSELIMRREPARDLYLNDLPVVRYLKEKRFIKFNSPITIFVGENGTGKSTPVEAIAVCAGFNAEGGTKNFTFSTNNEKIIFVLGGLMICNCENC